MKTPVEHGWESANTRRARRRFTWNALLWALIYPRRRERTRPTLPGTLLIALSFGVGMAAYNAANNILFIALSLLLACLVLSGVMAWQNFRGMMWRLDVARPLRAGQEAVVSLAVRNAKRVVPSYGLWFELAARPEDRRPAKAETTFTARGIDVREAWKRGGAAQARERLFLRTRLDPGGEERMEWVFKPARRGALRVELESIGSLFPFGFLKKSIGAEAKERAVVWPAPVEYRRLAAASALRAGGGERMARPGAGTDLLALRRYAAGDSHRLIHWKASARSRQLLVRQFAAESTEGFALRVDPAAAAWVRDEQFELLVSFAATLAEDLFRGDRLASVALGAEPAAAVRRVSDLEAFLDRLAVVEREAEAGRKPEAGSKRSEDGGREVGEGGRHGRKVITFAPDGPRGVAAWVDGEVIAAV
ncbi:MAG TPA: DUF58 domain-containing protein [Opitutus sp.]|nr:DUF58 domain-containing protein [Opitutus sp.]